MAAGRKSGVAFLAALALIALASIALRSGPSELVAASGTANLEQQIGNLKRQLSAAEGDVHTQRLEEANDAGNAGEISKPLLKATPRGRAIAAWGRHHGDTAEGWNAESQQAYDKAVHHAQIAERGGKEVYRPFQGQFSHEAAKVQKKFVGRFVKMIKMLEPTYMGEALQWARSNDSRENPVLSPITQALETPMIEDLNDEAKVRVNRAVEAIAKKEGLSLPQKEKLRAHLMAPLKSRILNRVHSQVNVYVTKMARAVVLQAANMTESGSQEAVFHLNGGDHDWGVGFPAVQKLEKGDLQYVGLLHDLDGIHKEGIIDKYDYQTQKAKLLSDWLKQVHHTTALATLNPSTVNP